jgi:DNA-binding IclR family transcriptional regulator
MKFQKEKLSSKNQSAVKALDIIELLANQTEPMRLQEISTQLKMNVSTALRFLISLTECGYVQQDQESLKYYLTFKICSLANKVSENIHLYHIALPFMKKVAERLDESVCLAIEQDMAVVYIGTLSRPNQMLRSMQRIGNRAPMHCTGVGKLLLLSHDENYIDQMTALKGLTSFTPNTITTRERLLDELSSVRRQDYAFDMEECELGAYCIAVPIRDYTQKVIAGLSVTGPSTRFTEERVHENIPFLTEQAKKLSRLLGYEE